MFYYSVYYFLFYALIYNQIRAKLFITFILNTLCGTMYCKVV